MDSVLRLAPFSWWKFHYCRFYFHHQLLKHCCLIKWSFGHSHNDDSQVKQSCGETVRCLKRYINTAVVVIFMQWCQHRYTFFNLISKWDAIPYLNPAIWLVYWGLILICMSWSALGRNMSNIVERWFLFLYLSTDVLSTTVAFKQYSRRLLPGSKSCLMKSDMSLV